MLTAIGFSVSDSFSSNNAIKKTTKKQSIFDPLPYIFEYIHLTLFTKKCKLHRDAQAMDI